MSTDDKDYTDPTMQIKITPPLLLDEEPSNPPLIALEPPMMAEPSADNLPSLLPNQEEEEPR